MKKLYIAIFTIIFMVSNCFSQKMKRGIELVSNYDQVLSANEIVYFGWDLSLVKINNSKLLGEEHELEPKFGKIIGLLSSLHTPESVSKKLEKKVIPKLNSIQRNYTKIDYSKIIVFNSEEMGLEKLKKHVKEYNLDENEGVGMVMIGEQFNRPERFATVFVVFFDIRSRDLFWVTRMKGLPDFKRSFPKKWMMGMEECLTYWAGKYYSQLLANRQ